MKPSSEGTWPTSGLAEVIHEHRGRKDIVADIRLRGVFGQISGALRTLR